MKTMRIEATVEQAYLAELERAREIFETLLNNKDSEEAEMILEQMIAHINQKYNMG